MAAGDSSDGLGEGPQEGVFGNLPASRPGSRSPRRDSGPGKRAAGGAKRKARGGTAKRPANPRGAGAAGRAKPGPKAAARKGGPKGGVAKPGAGVKPKPPPPPPPPPEAPAPAQRSGVEELAWAGVAVAAKAATLGVRTASRALEAVRKTVDR